MKTRPFPNVCRPVSLLTLALLVCGGLPAIAMAQDDAPQTVDLRPKFVEGRSVAYEYWTNRQTHVSIAAAGKRKEAGTIIASSGRIKLTIDSVTPDGAATGTLVYEWITINITGPDGTTKKNDSRSSGEIPPLQNLIQSIAGEPITVTFNAEGEATGLSGLDNIESKLENKKAMPQKRDFLETARILMGIPDAPAQASVGTRWSEQFTGSHQMGSMDYDTTWTLDSVGQLGDVPIPVASISGQSRMTLDVDRSKMPANAPPVQVQMTNSENQSQIWFDLQLGEIVGRNNVSTNTVTASMSVGTQTLTQTTTERSTEQFLRVAE